MSEVAGQLRDLGIERGWGSTVGSIRSTMLMLGDIIQAPDPETLQARLHVLRLRSTHGRAAIDVRHQLRLLADMPGQYIPRLRRCCEC